MTEAFRNLLMSLWNTTQMIVVYSIAILLVVMVVYLFCRLEVEAKKDKANK